MSKRSPDYLIDIVTDGLIRLLGRGGLSIEYNMRKDWGGQYVMLPDLSGPEPFEIHDADVLVASVRSLAEARAWKRKTGGRKVAIIDGEDGTSIEDAHSEVDIYYKRELLAGRSYSKNIKPLPFGMIPEPAPDGVEVNRKVFFRYIENHPIRGEVKRELDKLGLTAEHGHIEKQAYNKMLMSSLVGISARGGGWDTYRYWEIAFFGVAMLSQRLPIVIPDNFTEGTEVVFFDRMADFRSKLLEMLACPEKTVAIGQAARAKCLAKHMSVNRAKTVLEDLA